MCIRDRPGSDADKYTYSYKLALKDSKAKAVELTNDTGEFKDLKPDTDYLAYVMIKGNDKADKPYSDSDWSKAAAVHTLKAAADKPKAAPKLTEKTDTTIKLDTSTADLEYGVYLDSGDISWNSTGAVSYTHLDVYKRQWYWWHPWQDTHLQKEGFPVPRYCLMWWSRRRSFPVLPH